MNSRVTELTFDHHAPILEAQQGSMVATCEIDGMVTRFVWNGGEGDGVGQIHIQTGNAIPFFDWNVWDYETKSPSLEYTLPAFQEYVEYRLDSDDNLDVLRDMRTLLPLGV